MYYTSTIFSLILILSKQNINKQPLTCNNYPLWCVVIVHVRVQEISVNFGYVGQWRHLWETKGVVTICCLLKGAESKYIMIDGNEQVLTSQGVIKHFRDRIAGITLGINFVSSEKY